MSVFEAGKLGKPEALLGGRFTAIDLRALPGGLTWDVAALYSTGAITVVPEPATLGLLGLGALLAAARRRR